MSRKLGGPEKRNRYIPISHSDLAELSDKSPLPLDLQENKVFNYDISVFPFREKVSAVLGLDPDNLANLHLTDEGKLVLNNEIEGGTNQRKRGRQPHFLKRWTSSSGSQARREFDLLLDQFVEIFVSEHMGGSEVAYQREPTFRVVLPSGQPYGYRHCDADYHHPPAEVNWWLPLTSVFGSNTLHTESRPGLGDFSPVELEYGQVLRFYGNLCHHFTQPNITDTTRISFDMRVLSLDHHQDSWRDRLNRPCLFPVGSYYYRPGRDIFESEDDNRNMKQREQVESKESLTEEFKHSFDATFDHLYKL